MLHQAQQLELQQMLDSPTFKAAQEEVLRMADGSIESLLAPEAGIKMALEKGARNAFRLLRIVANPQASPTPPRARGLNNTK